MNNQPLNAWGAYGLRISGIAEPQAHLHPVPDGWPELELSRSSSPPDPYAPPGAIELGEDRADLWLSGPARIELTREPLRLRFHGGSAPSDAAILHPYLGLPAAIIARWLGRVAFHGAAFAANEQAWALLGDREAGKSTLLGQLLPAGAQALCDDIVILDRELLFAGPRSIDLRQDASVVLGGDALGLVGSRERWRLRPEAAAPALPIGGLIKLEWGEPVRLETLGPSERLDLLIASSALRPNVAEGPLLLELLAVPAWRFVRPRNLDRLQEVSDALLAELERVRRPTTPSAGGGSSESPGAPG